MLKKNSCSGKEQLKFIKGKEKTIKNEKNNFTKTKSISFFNNVKLVHSILDVKIMKFLFINQNEIDLSNLSYLLDNKSIT
jgi:hypothetical protein